MAEIAYKWGGGTDADMIIPEIALLLRDAVAHDAMVRAHKAYGDALAAGRIRDAIPAFSLLKD